LEEKGLVKVDYSYVQQKLTLVIHGLAIGKGDIRSRLNDTYQIFHSLTVNDFPPKLQSEWEWILKKINSKSPIINHKGDVIIGSVENSLKGMRNSTAQKIAIKILKLHETMEAFY
jgi:hypothetical protein